MKIPSINLKTIELYQVDAFTDRLFGGNPAAVCPLTQWLPNRTLQNIASENNLSETAFFIPKGPDFELRWFTPKMEVDLCGHATLAAAHVIFRHLNDVRKELRFISRFSGNLFVRRRNDWLTLDFPAWDVKPVKAIPKQAILGLGGLRPKEGYVRRDFLFVYEREEDIRTIKPDFGRLASLDHWVCITAPGKKHDFVSRFFCPGDGPDEDPVTGSAHSMLIPYWARRLGKNKLRARQLSQRGGELICELKKDRVLIAGQARTYMKGVVFLPEG